MELHGEASEILEEIIEAMMVPWRINFQSGIEWKVITARIIYNADQAILYYTKLINSIFDIKDKANILKDAKQMKPKDRVKVMVFTAASEIKVLLSMVGRLKKPRCFSLCYNRGPLI